MLDYGEAVQPREWPPGGTRTTRSWPRHVTQQTLRISDDQVVVAATTEPGSPSHAAMTLLVHNALTSRTPASQDPRHDAPVRT
ncbi:hypothetical protein [Nonomuraea rubra]|uniref:hypothetical protein n=1 Tax=Nonomuraea rubra TaxID=46180 RepID=UPI0033D63E9F